MDKGLNPFLLAGYQGPEYFCDREKEAGQLTRFFQNRENVTLFSIRRLGKTGLIHHVFHPFRNSRKTACIYVDILPTKNLEEFTNYLATAVYKRFPPERSPGKRLMEMFRLLRPVISFDELNGSPSLSLTFETPARAKNTIQQIFTFLDQQNIRIVFAIDEFQQILEYPEKNTEAILRTLIQSLKNTSFIFSGSNQKMMFEMFNSAKRPFFAPDDYRDTNLHLDYIPEKKYRDFIRRHFNENKREITDDCLSFICKWTCLHTFYTQYFCSTLFALNKKKTDVKDAQETAMRIFKINENTFFQYRNLLTPAQWDLLCAIGQEEKLHKPQSKNFVNRYGLGTPSLVARGLEALLKKEMIFHNAGVEQPYYEVYDKFLMRWIQHKFKK